MKVLVVSDIHDDIDRLGRILADTHGTAEAVVFCGDLSAPFTAALLAESGKPVYAVFGNCDEDQAFIIHRSQGKIEWTPIGQEFAVLKLGGRTIAVNHYPKLAELLAKTGEYDASFHGHTHEARNELVDGKTLLLNPGAVCGIQRGKRGTASYALYDTETNTAQIVPLNP